MRDSWCQRFSSGRPTLGYNRWTLRQGLVSFCSDRKEEKYGNYTHKFRQLLTRWDSRKLLWKVCLPVIQQHNLGCTGEIDQRNCGLAWNSQKHSPYRRQHGLPWHGGEATARGSNPGTQQHEGLSWLQEFLVCLLVRLDKFRLFLYHYYLLWSELLKRCKHRAGWGSCDPLPITVPLAGRSQLSQGLYIMYNMISQQ